MSNIGLNTVPSLHLKTKKDLEAFLAEAADKDWNLKMRSFNREEKLGFDMGTVRCDFTVGLIREMALAKGSPFATVYNAEVLVRLHLELGLSKLTDAEASKEGSMLSWIVYTSQSFNHADVLREHGFVLATQSMLDNALANKMKIELQHGTLLNPRLLDGRVYAFRPRKRNEAVSVIGHPIRLMPKAVADAVEAKQKAALATGHVSIQIGGGPPADWVPGDNERSLMTA
jgi:hypothetical protein